MTYDFAAVAQELKAQKPEIIVTHGQFVTSDDVYGIPEDDKKDIYGNIFSFFVVTSYYFNGAAVPSVSDFG